MRAVPTGRPLTVTCSRPGAGWPSAGVVVNVTANSAANACGSTTRVVASAILTVPQGPSVSRAAATQSVCSTAASVGLSYTVVSPASGKASNIVATSSNAQVNCTATPTTTGKYSVVYGLALMHRFGKLNLATSCPVSERRPTTHVQECCSWVALCYGLEAIEH